MELNKDELKGILSELGLVLTFIAVITAVTMVLMA